MTQVVYDISVVLCQSGKFETGQGTCALICMEQLGNARKGPCKHALEVHGKLAKDIATAMGARA